MSHCFSFFHSLPLLCTFIGFYRTFFFPFSFTLFSAPPSLSLCHLFSPFRSCTIFSHSFTFTLILSHTGYLSFTHTSTSVHSLSHSLYLLLNSSHKTYLVFCLYIFSYVSIVLCIFLSYPVFEFTHISIGLPVAVYMSPTLWLSL